MTLFYESIIPILLLAIAVGMDAFSVSLSVGLMRIRLRIIAAFILLVGAFHVLMPLAGVTLGHLLSHKLGIIAQLIGGWILIMIGAQMIVATLLQKDMVRHMKLTGFVVLAFTVSLDSFSVGLSLGMFGLNQAAIIMMFGLMSMIMATLGIMLAKQGKMLFGQYSEALGGIVLIVLGVQMVI
ncbi:manganese efflux pump MntP [Tenuibacillus multivorans]|uniref:Putative Mn2+ efflux pump MntP n=1 Tax=Tenuibacillus multivorans TaxID=237069 RepID=A0A1G9X1S0_9BACI|nr:manganese efflux pump [Tenuibacillus multivorans]GEL77262.1 putative manganese efflux pump MntP [Tenuibacillus multivorans]SDM90704.1 Putative Mn2+ efflux pump MntP [Tenuibacillus multivorans]